MARGVESLRSIGEVLECPDVEHNEGGAQLDEFHGQVDIKDVTFHYPGKDDPALLNVNVAIQPGETVAVVGASGGGKSTLMSLVIGFWRPQQGQIAFDGRPMDELDMRQVRKYFAVVPQQTVLISGTIRDNIIHGLDGITEERIQEVVKAARVDEFLAQQQSGLETKVGENGVQLSGGQRQRISIARALLRDPKLIILDEATSALDTESEHLVQQAIERLAAGRTTLIVAHRLSTIRHADRIMVMDQGQLVESGTWGALVEENGIFAEWVRPGKNLALAKIYHGKELMRLCGAGRRLRGRGLCHGPILSLTFNQVDKEHMKAMET